MKVFITGVNGFVGSHLLKMALAERDWEIVGFDLHDNNIQEFLDHPRFTMYTGDIFQEDELLDEQIKACDVLIPLIGIARPAYYVTRPLWTFELDFAENLKLIRKCAEYHKRVIFPSTSEVYGMIDPENPIMDEDTSNLILGPISKSRWIYSCSKQMMDRVIFAFGQEKGLQFTLFRPFNWIGPRLDSFRDAAERKGRSITQFIYDVLYTGKITLVNGGSQHRTFTYVDDCMRALLLIIDNKHGAADGEIFNIGNPDNHYSIREMAKIVIDEMKKFPEFKEQAERVQLIEQSSDEYYGKNYADASDRLPSINKIIAKLGWEPTTSLREGIHETLKWYAHELQTKGKVD